jgi:hypothetical protein
MQNNIAYYECDWCKLEEPVAKADEANWFEVTFTPVANVDNHSHLSLCASCNKQLMLFCDTYRCGMEFQGELKKNESNSH